ncbi:hypothetical protein EIN_174420 [Entamoeba invadens IP1]|uniref:Uncharacterized protein n=1 Tax=Entamoeba invadens IP1 TaxID=370355 RepID=A0A0A1TW53_ENTIV|nr:hypothetical protein EIN_174420 [Entamoeba invadens IP1]ELP84747.1 hypothetical protein EIN_174420 [Entamoeba invadens IP1]|eukprot:XP_004184093.1 hypothetical protein EIN_174420 [Entamoeba invadens IP1]
MAQRIKAIIVGDSGAGKSSLVSQLVNNEFPESKPVNPPRNFFNDFVFLLDKTKYRIQLGEFVDTNTEISGYGLEFKGARIVIGLVSSSVDSSLSNISNWLILRERLVADDIPYVKVLVQNIVTDQPKTITSEEAKQAAEKMGIHYFEINIKTGEGIQEMFKSVLNDVLNQDPTLKESASVQEGKKKGKGKKCIII